MKRQKNYGKMHMCRPRGKKRITILVKMRNLHQVLGNKEKDMNAECRVPRMVLLSVYSNESAWVQAVQGGIIIRARQRVEDPIFSQFIEKIKESLEWWDVIQITCVSERDIIVLGDIACFPIVDEAYRINARVFKYIVI